MVEITAITARASSVTAARLATARAILVGSNV